MAVGEMAERVGGDDFMTETQVVTPAPSSNIVPLKDMTLVSPQHSIWYLMSKRASSSWSWRSGVLRMSHRKRICTEIISEKLQTVLLNAQNVSAM